MCVYRVDHNAATDVFRSNISGQIIEETCYTILDVTGSDKVKHVQLIGVDEEILDADSNRNEEVGTSDVGVSSRDNSKVAIDEGVSYQKNLEGD